MRVIEKDEDLVQETALQIAETRIELPQWSYLLEWFPNFDIRLCTEPERLDYRSEDNLVGHGQRAWVIYHLIREFRRCNGKIGIEIGSGQAPMPFCLSTDKYWCEVHPEYGSGEYHPQLQCEGEKLPCTDSSVPYITASHSLEHCKDTLATLKEWLRVLEPGGAMIIVMPDAIYGPTGDVGHWREWTAEEFKTEILDKLVNENLIGVESYDDFQNHFSLNCLLRKL